LRNEADAMREIADFLLRDAEALENPGYVCLAQRLAGITAWSLDGDYLAARAHLEAAVALYDPARDAELGVRFGQDIGVAAMIYLAIVLWPLGEHAAARRWIDAALSRVRNSDHVPTLAFTGYMVSLFEMRRGSPQAALPHARAVMALAREHGLGFFLLNGAIVGEWAETLIHRNLESLAALERANAAVEAQGLRAGKAYSNVALAEALIACDRLDEAVEAAQRAVDCVRDEQLRAFEADAHFALGQALQRRRPEQPGLAAAAFGASLEVAKARRARSYELRAALALARLSGLSRENRRALSDAVAGFEATPECPDVAEARALLAG
jgi:tetratricopeptide (TPR) repeat protein